MADNELLWLEVVGQVVTFCRSDSNKWLKMRGRTGLLGWPTGGFGERLLSESEFTEFLNLQNSVHSLIL